MLNKQEQVDVQIRIDKPFKDYKDFLYKKLKTKADGTDLYA
jgi:hypothetical protein